MDIRALFRRKQWHVVERASEDHTYVCRRHGPFRHRAIAEQLARDVAASHEDCAARFAELEATVALLEAENARLKTDLGAASFIASERTRNGIVKWLNRVGPLHVAAAIAACEDINPP